MSDLNARFQEMLASAPKVQKVVGAMKDGTPIVVEVPSFFGATQ